MSSTKKPAAKKSKVVESLELSQPQQELLAQAGSGAKLEAWKGEDKKFIVFCGARKFEHGTFNQIAKKGLVEKAQVRAPKRGWTYRLSAKGAQIVSKYINAVPSPVNA
jgi:hypothetical protein